MLRTTNSNILRKQLLDFACMQEPFMPTVDPSLQRDFSDMTVQLITEYPQFTTRGGDIRFSCLYNRQSMSDFWALDFQNSTLYSGGENAKINELVASQGAFFRSIIQTIHNLFNSIVLAERYANIFKLSVNPSTDVNSIKIQGVFRFSLPTVSGGQSFHRNLNAGGGFMPIIQALHYFENPLNSSGVNVPNAERDTLLFVPKYHKRFTSAEQREKVVKTSANLAEGSETMGEFMVSHQRNAYQPEVNIKKREYIPREGLRVEFFPHTGYHAVVTKGFAQTRVLAAFNISIPVNSQMGEILTSCPLVSKTARRQLAGIGGPSSKRPSPATIIEKRKRPVPNSVGPENARTRL